MTRNEYESRARFITTITSESTAANADHLAGLLLRHGKTYSRIAEDVCNGVGTWCDEPAASFAKRQAKFEAALEHKEQLLEKRIKAIVAELGPGFTVNFEGDPRGHTIQVFPPSRQGQEQGIGVPTS